MFSFFKRKRTIKQNPVGFISYGGNYEHSLGRDYNSFAVEGYSNNTIAHRCIDYISTAVSTVALLAYTSQNGKLKKMDFQHPLNKILKRPNPVFGGAKFFENLIAYKLIAGNAYIIKNPLDTTFTRAPTELWLVRPDLVSVKPGRMGFPLSYEVKAYNEGVTIPVDQITGLSGLLQIKNFNPVNDYIGLSKFEPAAYSVDTFSSVLKWNKRLLDRGARPSGAFVSADKLSDEQFTKIKQTLDEQYSGADNAGRPLLLEGGMKFEEMQVNPKDMDYIQSKNTTARDICIAFGVPPQLIGLPDSQTYSNYAEAKTAFWQNTVLPILDSLVDDLNIWLSPAYGQNVFISYDKNDIDALMSIRAKQFEMLEKATFLTPNEKREAVGYEAIEGGGRLYIPANNVPADLVDSMNQTDPQAAKKYIMKTLPELAFEKLQESEK